MTGWLEVGYVIDGGFVPRESAMEWVVPVQVSTSRWVAVPAGGISSGHAPAGEGTGGTVAVSTRAVGSSFGGVGGESEISQSALRKTVPRPL